MAALFDSKRIADIGMESSARAPMVHNRIGILGMLRTSLTRPQKSSTWSQSKTPIKSYITNQE